MYLFFQSATTTFILYQKKTKIYPDFTLHLFSFTGEYRNYVVIITISLAAIFAVAGIFIGIYFRVEKVVMCCYRREEDNKSLLRPHGNKSRITYSDDPIMNPIMFMGRVQVILFYPYQAGGSV